MFTQPSFPPSSRSSARLRTGALLLLLLRQHLLPQHLLDGPQIIRLAVDDILQLLDVLGELVDLGGVELLRVVRRLLHVEARADVDEHVAGAGQLARDVEGGGQGDEEGFVWLGGLGLVGLGLDGWTFLFLLG